MDELLAVQFNNGLVWDIDNSTLLKLGEGRRVLQGIKGFNTLEEDHLQRNYGNPPTFNQIMWPLTNKKLSGDTANHWIFLGGGSQKVKQYNL